MKILRIFGIVMAVHAFAFILIFANPGCSTKSKPAPTPRDTVTATGTAGEPSISVPSGAAAQPAARAADPAPFSPAPSADRPAGDSPNLTFDAGAASRYTPTRPNSPAASALQTEPVAGVTPATTITVAKGDSLWSIAKRHGVTIADLAAVNNLKTSAVLRVGQKLVVPAKSGAGVAAAAARAEARAPASAPAASKKQPQAAKAQVPGGVRHVVKAGETLSIIARKYGVKVGDLAEANVITNHAMIRVGQELVIPGAKAPKPAAAAGASRDSAAAPAAQPQVMPQVGIPSPDQDLDSGLRKQGEVKVPVIRVDDAPVKDQPPVPVANPTPKN